MSDMMQNYYERLAVVFAMSLWINSTVASLASFVML